MSKVSYIDPIKSMHGKVHGKSDFWYMERYGTQYTAHKNNPRDYSKKPQSEAEKAGTSCYIRNRAFFEVLIKFRPVNIRKYVCGLALFFEHICINAKKAVPLQRICA